MPTPTCMPAASLRPSRTVDAACTAIPACSGKCPKPPAVSAAPPAVWENTTITSTENFWVCLRQRLCACTRKATLVSRTSARRGALVLSPPPATASAVGAQLNGRPFPATASAEGGAQRVFNVPPSQRERVRVRDFVCSSPLPGGRESVLKTSPHTCSPWRRQHH